MSASAYQQDQLVRLTPKRSVLVGPLRRGMSESLNDDHGTTIRWFHEDLRSHEERQSQ
jgi:hypothetical protein